MKNSLNDIQRHGQSVWYDNVSRGLIESGELRRLIGLGVTGLTSNPTIFQKAITGSDDYDDAFKALVAQGKDADAIYESLAISDIKAAADELRPVYDESDGVDGYASLEVNPHLAHDTGGTVDEARRLFAELGRPNVMMKVPATPAGMPAIRRLIGDGINVNVTLLFSLDAYREARQAYMAGLEDLRRADGDLARVASVASFFVSRVDTAVDTLLGDKSPELAGQTAVANAKLAYRDFQVAFDGELFASLREAGARVQRPLWASTGTKNPAYSDVLYVESLIGQDTVNTMPEATLFAFLDHGRAGNTIVADVDEATRLVDEVGASGVSIDDVTSELLTDGVKLFSESFDELMADIERQRVALAGS
jgi:transaldolase/glucose-6-phosphate isomerase